MRHIKGIGQLPAGREVGSQGGDAEEAEGAGVKPASGSGHRTSSGGGKRRQRRRRRRRGHTLAAMYWCRLSMAGGPRQPRDPARAENGRRRAGCGLVKVAVV